jgi:hypothetical protein
MASIRTAISEACCCCYGCLEYQMTKYLLKIQWVCQQLKLKIIFCCIRCEINDNCYWHTSLTPNVMLKILKICTYHNPNQPTVKTVNCIESQCLLLRRPSTTLVIHGTSHIFSWSITSNNAYRERHRSWYDNGTWVHPTPLSWMKINLCTETTKYAITNLQYYHVRPLNDSIHFTWKDYHILLNKLKNVIVLNANITLRPRFTKPV